MSRQLSSAAKVEVPTPAPVSEAKLVVVRGNGFNNWSRPGKDQYSVVKESLYNSRVKRAVDILGASALIALTAPLMGVVAVAIRTTSPGSALFRQRRLTAGGKVFTIYKFRTMKLDAEVKSGPVWAVTNDPRVTSLGRFLRKTRLDELPQLFNVLKGDMSLIGPRPERPEMADSIQENIPGFHRRLEVRAGLSGLAQVSHDYPDGMDSYKRKLAFDRLYVQKQSFLLDCAIAFKTIGVMITGKGAR